MRFWDASAVVPLLIEEPHSNACRDLLRTDPRQTVWYFTRTEVVSALARHWRQGGFSADEFRRSESRLAHLARRWSEVDPSAPVRELAEQLLRVHSLRAADALQLAAALAAIEERPRGHSFVSLDEALLAAAQREGFDAVRPME